MTDKKEKGLFQQVWDDMPWWDKAALMTAPVPVLGDVVGFAADAKNLYDDPSLANAGLMAAGLLPWVPSAGITRTAQKAMTNLRNDIPGFYGGGGRIKQAAAWANTMPEGVSNMVKSRYAPEARAIQKEFNVSVADQKAARNALKISAKVTPELRSLEGQLRKMKKAGEDNTPAFKAIDEKAKALRSTASQEAKKSMGQLNQSRSMLNQYRGTSAPKGFLDNIDEIDHVATFEKFNLDDYYDTVGDLSGMAKDEVGEIFKQIETLPAIGMKGKDYQMNIRRVHSGSAGNLQQGLDKFPMFGGKSINELKSEVFEGGKGFNRDAVFLDKLEKAGVRVLNPDAILKGKPAIVTGSAKTDAFEIGGANYMTAINKRGKLVSIVNDEHDMLGQKMPGAARYMNVSEPIVYDLVKNKKPTAKQLKAQAKLKNKKVAAEARAIENYKKVPGVDVSGKVPAGFKTREQWARAQAVAKLQPTSKDYSRLLADVGGFGSLRAAKATLRPREETNE